MRLKHILIKSKAIGEVHAELTEDKNPNTTKSIWASLPIKARANTWGDEIYFSICLDIKTENSQQIVEKGDIGYWPPGKAFCIFFGPTPASVGNDIRAASPVNIFGKILGNIAILKNVEEGDEIIVNKAE
ncbi:MAG: uncharacterized protein QG670_23 [Thermoproteota archaeon]|nr:uncharacterized protein [Thermoproteota archaeon]